MVRSGCLSDRLPRRQLEAVRLHEVLMRQEQTLRRDMEISFQQQRDSWLQDERRQLMAGGPTARCDTAQRRRRRSATQRSQRARARTSPPPHSACVHPVAQGIRGGDAAA